VIAFGKSFIKYYYTFNTVFTLYCTEFIRLPAKITGFSIEEIKALKLEIKS